MKKKLFSLIDKIAKFILFSTPLGALVIVVGVLFGVPLNPLTIIICGLGFFVIGPGMLDEYYNEINGMHLKRILTMYFNDLKEIWSPSIDDENQ